VSADLAVDLQIQKLVRVSSHVRVVGIVLLSIVYDRLNDFSATNTDDQPPWVLLVATVELDALNTVTLLVLEVFKDLGDL
jgi:hypothetical protein